MRPGTHEPSGDSQDLETAEWFFSPFNEELGGPKLTPALSTADPGTVVEIDAIPDDTIRARLLRLGFLDGPVECRRRVRNGPVLLRRNGTDLAIGKSIADEITVTEPDR